MFEEAIRLDSGTYDLASWVAGGDGQHPLWLGQGAVLKGSGDFGGDLLNALRHGCADGACGVELFLAEFLHVFKILEHV